ncbi:sigma 54-interacting transcriptional regulator [Clostridium sp. FP1]|uniref:sigma 54-interacting transcriptional regulator n=1 Tax=Clostridium sp. FP1 TaxID=2724076 RepID=UPI001CC914FD|nr:sigma 54-interacting transcriptional regulator [Clostridium sp. FP1]MBZ9634667.1 sigma 54-interacting transcriptional regulator [Clostridium sp. FP1]
MIELSNKGTLFLDEIGDMDVNLQTKLLRVLQDKVVFPIGSIKGTKINVRFIAVTNKDLKQEVKTNNFRKDLFYRLNVIHISMPPLRERREDIPRLVDHFLKKYNILLSKDIKGISAKALQAIEKYKFDGNVRELQNIIERAVALTRDDFINTDDLPEDVFFSENIVSICDDIIPIYVGENMKSIERRVIGGLLFSILALVLKQSGIITISMDTTFQSPFMIAFFTTIGLGATPNAIANMGAVTEKYGPSPKAFLIVPLVGAFLIDLIGIPTIVFFMNLFK